MKRNLALFDFDGTLTRKDTFLELIKFTHGKYMFYQGMTLLLPVLILYKAGFLKNWRAKEIVFSYFFKNKSIEVFRKNCKDFAIQKIPYLIRPSAWECLNKHLHNGDHVVIVTASSSEWISNWSEPYAIQLITTEWQIEEERLTGKISGNNCFGPVKRDLIRSTLNLKDYDSIYAYGDTSGDREMLSLANYPFYKTFKD